MSLLRSVKSSIPSSLKNCAIADDTDNALSREEKSEITPRKKSRGAPYAAHTNFDKNADLSGFAEAAAEICAAA